MARTLKWTALTTALIGLAFWGASTVNAQTKGPCAEDLAKFCKDVQPGGGRLAKCLKAHEGELSPACKAGQEQARARAREAHEACADDVQKLCREVQPGGGRVIRCLKENSKSLSSECREKLTAARPKTK
jgi:hypothetical protein